MIDLTGVPMGLIKRTAADVCARCDHPRKGHLSPCDEPTKTIRGACLCPGPVSVIGPPLRKEEKKRNGQQVRRR